MKKKIESIIQNETYKKLIQRNRDFLRDEYVKGYFLPDEVRGRYSKEGSFSNDFIIQLSPFKMSFTSEYPHLDKEFKCYYSDGDYLFLSKEAKEELAEIGLVTMMKNIEEKQKQFLRTDMMTESDFLENKLEYLVRYGEEAIEIKDEEMKYLLEQIKILLREAHKYAFRIEESKALDKLTKEISKQLFLQYLIRCMKKFPFIAAGHVINVGEYYLERLNSLKEEEIQEYKELSICPIAYGLNNDNLSKFKIKKLFIISVNFEKVKSIVKNENLKEIVESYLKTSNKILKEIDEGKKLYDIFRGEAFYGNALIKILETVPKLQNYI